MFKNLQGLIHKYLQSPFTFRNDITSYRQLRIYKNILALPQPCTNIFFACVLCMGYWPSVRSRWLDIGQVSFFACLWTETKSRSINSQKQERGQYPAILTEQPWSIKDLLYGFRGNFARGMKRVVPSGQDGSILPARVANHSARFGSSCPLTELTI